MAKRSVSAGVVVRPSSFDELWLHAGTMVVAHGREVDDQPGDPHELRYHALEQAGVLRCLAAWDGSQLVGYATVLIGPDLHHQNRLVAQVDAIYVVTSHRGRGAGLALLRTAVKCAREAQASEFICHAKPSTPLDSMLRSMGYVVRHTVYGMRI